MIFTIDRIVEDVVVLEDENGDTVTVSVETLPAVRAGDVLRLENGVYTVLDNETEKRRNAAFALEQKLRQKFRK